MRIALILFLFCSLAGAFNEEVGWEPKRIIALSDYPLIARQAAIQGTVKLRFTLDEEGRVATVIAISGHPLLRAAASENAMRWLFRPASQATPSGYEVTLIYTFKLAGEPVRRPPKVQFSIDYPNQVSLECEPVCPDHIACTPEEIEQTKKGRRKHVP